MANFTKQPSIENYNFFYVALAGTVPNNRFTSIKEYKEAISLIGKHYKDSADQGFRFKTVLFFDLDDTEHEENNSTFKFWVNDNMIYINILHCKSNFEEKIEESSDLKILEQIFLTQSEFIKSIKIFRGLCPINWIKYLSSVEEVQWKGTFDSFNDKKEEFSQLNHPTLRKLMFCDNTNFNIGDVIKYQNLNELIMNTVYSNSIHLFYDQLKQLSECKGIITQLNLSFHGNSTLDLFLKYYKQQNNKYHIKVNKLKIIIWGPHENFKDNNLDGLSTIFKADGLILSFNGFKMPLDFQPTTIRNLQRMCEELMAFKTLDVPKLDFSFNPDTMKPYNLDLLYNSRYFFNDSSLKIIEELMRQERILVACSGLNFEKNPNSFLAMFAKNNLFDRNLLPFIFQHVK